MQARRRRLADPLEPVAKVRVLVDEQTIRTVTAEFKFSETVGSYFVVWRS